jgi:EmrB/QacA subfamily drug resistance transporter
VLAALMLTLLLEALDQTVVGTALPKIIAQLNGFDRYTWVVTAYLLASTTMIPIVSKLSDQFGRKWFFIVGVVLFLLGSALSGASQTMNQLIAFRALQGLGSGIGIALVFTVVGDIFPPAERAKWQGIFAAVYGFSSVVGPTAGGWLTDNGPLVGNFITNDTRWRWVFYVNLPLGILALAAILIFLPTNISVRSNRLTGLAAFRRIDFLGAALASTATICLLLGLTWGSDQTYDWNSPQVIGTLVAAAVLYTIFFIAERFAVEPILPLDLFRNRVFAADSLLTLTSGMVLLSLVIYLPLFLQGVLRESATNSGEVITPLTISLVIGSTFAGIMIARLARYQIVTIIGAALLTIGTFLLSRMSASTSIFTAACFMVIAGLGMGCFFPVLTLAVQNAIPRSRMGVGTGAITYLRALGQTLGVAITGTVVNNTIASDIQNRLPAAAKAQIPPVALKYATNPQVLVSPQYHDQVVAQGLEQALKHGVPGLSKSIATQIATQQTANIPAGPQHDQAFATIYQQVLPQAVAQATKIITDGVHSLYAQVFAALRVSLEVGIQHGFVTVLIFCIGVIAGALLLKDVPLAKEFRESHAGSEGGGKSEDATEYVAL